jgi:hypothetical protein
MEWRSKPVILMLIGCMVIFCISYILLTIPIINYLAILLGAPWWFGIAIILTMLTTTVLAITRAVPLAWLLMPIGYLAGIIGLAQISESRAKEKAAQIEKNNAANKWRAPTPFEYRAIDKGSVGYSELVERFRHTTAIFADEKESTVRYFAKGSDCDNASKHFDYKNRFEKPWLYRKDIFPSNWDSEKTRQCVLSKDYPGKISPHYSVTNDQSRNFGDWLNPQIGEEFTVRDERTGAILAKVETSTIRTVTPFQIFTVSCKQSSLLAPFSRCGIYLPYQKESIPAGYKTRTDDGNPFIPTDDPMNSRVGALGKAIGLIPREQND